jgi:hypothetical protein
MLLIGTLGGVAALVGVAFIGFQKAMWIGLGTLYVLIGLVMLSGKANAFMRTVGPGLARLKETRGAVGLGLVFGLNIPACVAPLVFALLGLAAATGATTGAILQGFVSLASGVRLRAVAPAHCGDPVRTGSPPARLDGRPLCPGPIFHRSCACWPRRVVDRVRCRRVLLVWRLLR